LNNLLCNVNIGLINETTDSAVKWFSALEKGDVAKYKGVYNSNRPKDMFKVTISGQDGSGNATLLVQAR